MARGYERAVPMARAVVPGADAVKDARAREFEHLESREREGGAA